jgi:hypothetical protein
MKRRILVAQQVLHMGSDTADGPAGFPPGFHSLRPSNRSSDACVVGIVVASNAGVLE